MQEALGTRLNFNTVFHPQTDVQSEIVIQVLEDMLRSCVINYEGSWDRHIPLVELVYNNSFQSSIGMVPFEALYGRKCRTPLCWTELSENTIICPNLIQETKEKVKMIRERLKVATDRQKSYADSKRKEIRYDIGEKVTGPDPDTPPGFPGWSRLVEFHCTIPRKCTKGPHLKEK